jgi:hypothetical protein
MPDQSTASNEHALLQEITAPLANLPDDPVPSVADVDFPIALRGYDRMAVDAYVRRTSQLVAELQATRSPENAVRRALERVGEEVSGILKRAHETASQITAQSRSDAEDRLETARREAAEITAGAERRLRELDVETDRIWAERHRIVEDARTLAEQLLVLAQSAAERFPADEEPAATEEGAAPQLFDGEGDGGDASIEADAEDETEATQRLAVEHEAPEQEAAEKEAPEHGAPQQEAAEQAGSEPDDVEATAIMPTLKNEDEHSA